jgi:phosphatidylglycerol lysyltransferase
MVDPVIAWLTARVPLVTATATFAAGLVLLASGATPSLAARVERLDAVLPLGVIEVSHFASVSIGVMLILVARAVHQRLDAAWHLVVGALLAGIALSLLKGLEYEDAALLTAALALVVGSRRPFWRRAAVLSEPLPWPWIAAVALAISGMIALGFFSYSHVAYRHALWSEFATGNDASRFLRAMAGGLLTAIAFTIARLMQPAPYAAGRLSTTQQTRLEEIIRSKARPAGNLAFLGDKSVMLADDSEGFLMYAIRGRSWVALGDPVGDSATRRELAWKFSRMARQHGGQPVFYEVSPDMLGPCAEIGMRMVKIGEEARVSLEGFTLDVPGMRKFRTTVRQFERAGVRAELLAPGDVEKHLAELREVSDAWLAEKGRREKTFSVGRFDAAYLSRFPILVVRDETEILAFANLWTSKTSSELSVDLMRYRPRRHNGIMDYLFIEAMRYGAREGYRWFSLGMAPLAGLENRSGAPLWTRAGALLFAHGDSFYHFKGLRSYKEKFAPTWEPRYLAVPSTLSLPGTLANVTFLISGGMAGILRR